MLHFVTLQPRLILNEREPAMSESMPDLGDLEREVMQLIWANGRLTAETVREKLARRLKESTVRTVLRRLEEKGYVVHAVEGRTYGRRAGLACDRVHTGTLKPAGSDPCSGAPGARPPRLAACGRACRRASDAPGDASPGRPAKRWLARLRLARLGHSHLPARRRHAA